jgi:predicted AAA+ superfamily ATPase
MQQVSETLAGRATYLTLWPMTRREQLGLGRAGIWQELLEAKDSDWEDIVAAQQIGPEDWHQLARRGGYPVPALDLRTDDARATWFVGYTQTYLERDLRELSVIAALPDLRRVMRAVCLRLGQLLNQTELGRDAAVPQPTVHRWLNLLETSYQLVRLPPYAVNRTKRVIKTPKVYWADTGLALHLAGIDEPAGCHLENLVLNDLLAWRDARLDRPEVLYWRTATGEEVDFVIEAGRTLLPIEVKATARPRLGDAKNLRAFHEEYGRQCRPGLVLHTGDAIEWLAPRVLAAPWWRVL